MAVLDAAIVNAAVTATSLGLAASSGLGGNSYADGYIKINFANGYFWNLAQSSGSLWKYEPAPPNNRLESKAGKDEKLWDCYICCDNWKGVHSNLAGKYSDRQTAT